VGSASVAPSGGQLRPLTTSHTCCPPARSRCTQWKAWSKATSRRVSSEGMDAEGRAWLLVGCRTLRDGLAAAAAHRAHSRQRPEMEAQRWQFLSGQSRQRPALVAYRPVTLSPSLQVGEGGAGNGRCQQRTARPLGTDQQASPAPYLRLLTSPSTSGRRWACCRCTTRRAA
jgi:hypothetical protein